MPMLICLLQTEVQDGTESCLGSILKNMGQRQSLKGQERFQWEEGIINKSTHLPGSLLIISFCKNPRKILSNHIRRRASVEGVQPSGNQPSGKALGGECGEDYLIGSG